ncbi:hypothetical protein HPB52_004463 [Rhipicephalus sanguineus]|uniref:Uncharacterized protein n=1 Tax=Rhipicephalus sanguineus TaxID=34632 RepID=A0A9D4PES1_RHISA|nr:hypothetical protein HPB52_004463 [Rhipicephalus sanguineus]
MAVVGHSPNLTPTGIPANTLVQPILLDGQEPGRNMGSVAGEADGNKSAGDAGPASGGASGSQGMARCSVQHVRQELAMADVAKQQHTDKVISPKQKGAGYANTEKSPQKQTSADVPEDHGVEKMVE